MFLSKELSDDLGHVFERKNVGTPDLISIRRYLTGGDQSRNDVIDSDGLHTTLAPRREQQCGKPVDQLHEGAKRSAAGADDHRGPQGNELLTALAQNSLDLVS